VADLYRRQFFLFITTLLFTFFALFHLGILYYFLRGFLAALIFILQNSVFIDTVSTGTISFAASNLLASLDGLEHSLYATIHPGLAFGEVIFMLFLLLFSAVSLRG